LPIYFPKFPKQYPFVYHLQLILSLFAKYFELIFIRKTLNVVFSWVRQSTNLRVVPMKLNDFKLYVLNVNMYLHNVYKPEVNLQASDDTLKVLSNSEHGIGTHFTQ